MARRATTGRAGVGWGSSTLDIGGRATGERVAAISLPGPRPAASWARWLFKTTTPPTAPTAPASIVTPATRRSRRSPNPCLAGSTAAGHSPALAGSTPAPFGYSTPAPFKYSSSEYTR